MGLSLENLDDRTRQLMLDEFQQDVAHDQLYISPHLTVVGRSDYKALLRAAIQSGTETSLADSLRSHGRMRLTRQWRTATGNVATELPPTAADTLAEAEFHRFYVRGVCRRALEEGIHALVIYRAKAAIHRRVKSEAMIGVTIDASSLLEDLQTRQAVEPGPGLPAFFGSGLSVRLP